VFWSKLGKRETTGYGSVRLRKGKGLWRKKKCNGKAKKRGGGKNRENSAEVEEDHTGTFFTR